MLLKKLRLTRNRVDGVVTDMEELIKVIKEEKIVDLQDLVSYKVKKS